MEKHEYNIFMTVDDDYQNIKRNIEENGYDETLPVVIFEGKILDGYHRWRACQELGVKPATTQFRGSREDALNYSIRTNMDRRQMNSSQKACIAALAEPFYEAIRSEVESERIRKMAETKTGMKYGTNSASKKLDGEITQPSHGNKTVDRVAKAYGTNNAYVSEANRLKEQAPEAFQEVLAGKKTISEVKKEQKKQEREQVIQKQSQEIQQNKYQPPSGEFDVIVIDPPWNYGRKYDPEGSRVANPYPEMTQEELKAIDLPDKKDAILFLWTTHQFLWDAKELLDHWGYTYKATLVWDKEKIGMGAWYRMQCEFCLLGIKGKPLWDNTTYRDIIREPRREHSRKPEAFYKMVEDITVGYRLDWFAREQREGWVVYGNDTTKF